MFGAYHPKFGRECHLYLKFHTSVLACIERQMISAYFATSLIGHALRVGECKVDLHEV